MSEVEIKPENEAAVVAAPVKKSEKKGKTSIKTKIGGALGVGVAALLVLGAAGGNSALEMGSAIGELTLNSDAIKRQGLMDMQHDAARGNVQSFLTLTLADLDKEDRAQRFKAAKKDYDEGKVELFKNLDDNSKMGEFDDKLAAQSADMRPGMERMVKQGDKVEQLAKAYIELGADVSEADRKAKQKQVFEEYDKFFKLFEEMEEKAAELTVAYTSKSGDIKDVAETLRARSLIIQGIALSLSLLIMGLMVAGLFKGLNRKMAGVLGMIDKIKGNDLEVAYGIEEDDEFKSIGDSLGAMATDIKVLQENNALILKKAEDENQDLNDSIVELLETVFAMTKKDLTVKAEVKENVVGTIADSINMVIRSTNAAMVNTSQIAEMVQGASQESQEKSTEIFELSRRSKEVVGSVIEKVEKSLAEIRTISKVAQESKAAADKATESTSQALSIVKETVSSMGSIRETISSTETKIKKLAERSQEIGFIVQLIGDISERTHVLALNATIQAAVAGDAGRGFAAIAEEIQKLAENTKEATNKIARLVENIQVETSDTIQMVNQTIDKVVSGVKLAESSGQQMTETQGKTVELADAVRKISLAIAEHEALTGEMKGGAETLGGTQDEFSSAAQDQLMRARSLMSFSMKLQETVNEFKTS